jgi:hypothetical protein
MKYILFLMFLFGSLRLYSQPKRIYIKLEINDPSKHIFGDVYITGLGNLVRSMPLWLGHYMSFACDSSDQIVIIPDCRPPYNSIVFPHTKFSCGDSVIANLTSGTFKVINKR